MAFLSKEMIEKKTIEVGVKPHPVLEKCDLPASVRLLYLEGCVLAALLDDAKLSDIERTELYRLGYSLSLSSADIAEAEETISGLLGESQQSEFVSELKASLGRMPIEKFFMDDFVRVANLSGEGHEDVVTGIDFIGAQIVGAIDWREAIAQKEAAELEYMKKKEEEAAAARDRAKPRRVRLEEAYAKGDEDAGVDLALMYLTRDGYEFEDGFIPDSAKGVSILREIVGKNKSNRRAQFELGMCYFERVGVTRNYLDIMGTCFVEAASATVTATDL